MHVGINATVNKLQRMLALGLSLCWGLGLRIKVSNSWRETTKTNTHKNFGSSWMQMLFSHISVVPFSFMSKGTKLQKEIGSKGLNFGSRNIIVAFTFVAIARPKPQNLEPPSDHVTLLHPSNPDDLKDAAIVNSSVYANHPQPEIKDGAGWYNTGERHECHLDGARSMRCIDKSRCNNRYVWPCSNPKL